MLEEENDKIDSNIEQIIEENFTFPIEYNKMLKNYFQFDEDKKCVYVDLKFNSVDDLFDTSVGNFSSLMVNKDAVDTMDNILKMIPKRYCVEFIIKIKDTKNYPLDFIKKNFMTSMGLLNFMKYRDNHKKEIASISLLSFGILLLLLNVIFFGSNLFPNISGTWKNIASEILDIAAWVFVWEAITIYFIELKIEKIKERNMKKRIKKISFEKIK